MHSILLSNLDFLSKLIGLVLTFVLYQNHVLLVFCHFFNAEGIPQDDLCPNWITREGWGGGDGVPCVADIMYYNLLFDIYVIYYTIICVIFLQMSFGESMHVICMARQPG